MTTTAHRGSTASFTTPIDARVRIFTVPLEEPEGDGTFTADATTAIVIELDAGEHRGLGYAYCDRAVATLVDSKLAELVEGGDAMHPTESFDGARDPEDGYLRPDPEAPGHGLSLKGSASEYEEG